MMSMECHSYIGNTRNPWNTGLSPAGSSGCRSALLAFGGAIMSIGSDIGGSLRTPAAANGLWAMRATALRVPRGTIRSTSDLF